MNLTDRIASALRAQGYSTKIQGSARYGQITILISSQSKGKFTPEGVVKIDVAENGDETVGSSDCRRSAVGRIVADAVQA